ncbi:transposase [Sclerotinia borealis F-4128]|uniref:Transposase n=1 Tax=Sclerotinia borealis (strain F-4128) TaxID=1432307 RepID=W9C7F3_SCLBF|nr:transposase [Sclerotinia borealis F-4128]
MISKLHIEDDIAAALNAIVNGVSMRKAALDYGIPRTTLYNRINGRVSHQKSHQTMQKIAPIQEKRLVEWILVQKSLGTSPTHRQIREIGERLLDIKNSILPLESDGIDSARVSGASHDIIAPWFQKLELPEIIDVKPENRYNIDEAGIMEGQDLNGLVSLDIFYRVYFSDRASTHATRHFKGKHIQQQWFPTDLALYQDWNFIATDNGWTTDATGLEWLEKVFIPQTTPSEAGDARLLILNGYGSHETMPFMYRCFENNIYLLFLPPHISHALQPLDLSVFSPLKNAYRHALNNLNSLSDSTPIGKRSFLHCYQKARMEALIVHNIKAGWKASGLWPKNRAKPLMSRLLLENSNQEVLAPNPASDDDPQLQWNIGASAIIWKTPQKASDLRLYASTMTQEKEPDLPTRRLLFRKIIKAFDIKNYNLMESGKRIKQLEYQLDAVVPKKRRKVVTSPNTRFSGIRAIREAQIVAGDRGINAEDSDDTIESGGTGDFIEFHPASSNPHPQKCANTPATTPTPTPTKTKTTQKKPPCQWIQIAQIFWNAGLLNCPIFISNALRIPGPNVIRVWFGPPDLIPEPRKRGVEEKKKKKEVERRGGVEICGVM